jgi:hypothetical protein
MVRQAFQLLPDNIKNDIAFIHAQRVAQDPEAAMKYMQGKKHVVIVGSFKGVNSSVNADPIVDKIHSQEIKALELTVKLSNAIGINIKDVIYGMGDSSPQKTPKGFVQNPFGEQKKALMERQLNSILHQNGVKLSKKLSWGADELMLVAFAKQLPDQTISLNIQNPKAKNFYDGNSSTYNLALQAADKAGLRIVPQSKSNIEADIYSLVDGTNNSGAQTFPIKEKFVLQHSSDIKFARDIQLKSAERTRKTVIIDARLNNGAMDRTSLPSTTNVLGYSAWGTGGNNLGQAFAMAKIVDYAQKQALNTSKADVINAARRQLVIESIAHDGLFLEQRTDSVLKQFQSQAHIPRAPGALLTEGQLTSYYRFSSEQVTKELTRRYPGLNARIQFAPQPYNRRFEAATMVSNGVLTQAGSFSSEFVTNKYPEFDPKKTYRGYSPKKPITSSAIGSNGIYYSGEAVKTAKPYKIPNPFGGCLWR